MGEQEQETALARLARRERAVNDAVRAADRIILEASRGTVEETNYLTCEVAHAFIAKVQCALFTAVTQRDFLDEVPRKKQANQ
jgi:hypothetical protein